MQLEMKGSTWASQIFSFHVFLSRFPAFQVPFQPAMEVCFLASGEKVAVLQAAEFEGKTAEAVKQALAPKIGVTRFRQRLFVEGDAVEIHDDDVITSVPPKVQLVVLIFFVHRMQKTTSR
jgi:hypothetical protein